MTRGWLVTTCILLAATACIGTALSQAWRPLVYEKITMGQYWGVPAPDIGEPVFLIPPNGQNRVMWKKKWVWIPGRDLVADDGRCSLCLQDKHGDCSDIWLADNTRLPCTCPHPSHAQESE